MPKVSILVPVYNVEKYLRECLDSIINQTLKDIEIICINDGSTDSSAQILEEYRFKDKRIKVINKANSGYGASMNRGLEEATGEYIGIVESDDFVRPEMFEKLYDIANKNNLDMVKSDFYNFYTTKKQARQAGKIKKKYLGKVLNIKNDPIMIKIQPSIWSAIYKKDFLNVNSIRFLETPGASYQDTSFAFKTIASAKRLMFTNKAYVYYRQDNENSSVKSRGKVYSICDEWEEITRFLDERPEIKDVVNQVKLSTHFNAYKWNAIRIEEKYREEFIDKYQKTFKQYYENGEIKEEFYKKAKKEELLLLLNDKAKYLDFIKNEELRKKQKEKRQKFCSIRINSSRISIVLFGKQIVEIG